MTFRQRIAFDRLLAVPLAVALNALVRVVGLILKRDHSFDASRTRRIVVCKLVGMGSIIQATPLLRGLRKKFPGACLSFVTLESNRAFVNRLESVDEVLCLDDSSPLSMLQTTARTILHLMSIRADHYFDLEIYSGFACLLSVFSLSWNRLGFYRHSNRFKKGIYTHLVYFNTRMPVRKIYLQLGRVAGLPEGSDDTLETIRIEEPERSTLRQKLSDAGLKSGTPYVLVNPNASDLLIERRWPEAHVVSALTRLAELGHDIVLMGARSEAPFVNGLWERIPESLRARVHNTAGRLSLGEALALIDGAACVLTNDTGPMHMAFALGRSTVCLFGPAEPTHYGMETPKVITLYAPVPCSPCIYEVDEPPCHGDNICMQRLQPEMVVKSVISLLAAATSQAGGAAQGGAGGTIRLPLVWDDPAGKPLGIIERAE